MKYGLVTGFEWAVCLFGKRDSIHHHLPEMILRLRLC